MSVVKPVNTVQYYVSELPIKHECHRTIRNIVNVRVFDGFKTTPDGVFPVFRIDNCILHAAKESLKERGIEITPLK